MNLLRNFLVNLFTQWVTPLQARLHAFPAPWLFRCFSETPSSSQNAVCRGEAGVSWSMLHACVTVCPCKDKHLPFRVTGVALAGRVCACKHRPFRRQAACCLNSLLHPSQKAGKTHTRACPTAVSRLKMLQIPMHPQVWFHACPTSPLMPPQAKRTVCCCSITIAVRSRIKIRQIACQPF